MIQGRTRDLAMFNVAIDSKLRGCDVVALMVEDVAHGRPGSTHESGPTIGSGCGDENWPSSDKLQ
jgi:hypothetical protein